MEWIAQQYGRIFSFYRNHVRKTYRICLLLFLILAAVTAFGVTRIPTERFFAFLQEANINEMMENLVHEVGGSWFSLCFHNLRAGAVSVLTGCIPFLFLPALILLVNALILGGAVGLIGLMGQNIFLGFVAMILPHGIFELPANVLSYAIGIVVCRTLARQIRGKNEPGQLRETLLNCILLFLLVCVPLLLIAAPVEMYVTPRIAEALLHVPVSFP